MRKLTTYILLLLMLFTISPASVADAKTLDDTVSSSITYTNGTGESQETIVLDEVFKNNQIINAPKKHIIQLPKGSKDKSIEELNEEILKISDLSKEEAYNLSKILKSNSSTNNLPNAVGDILISTTEDWYTKPYIAKTLRLVTYTTSWIGLDSYRSAVGITQTTSKEKSVNYTIGFSGSTKIKDYNASLSASIGQTHKTVVSQGTNCPGWYTMNWRPYVVYYNDYYAGVREVRKLYYSTSDLSYYVELDYVTVEGQNARDTITSTEVWSRENSSHNVNAVTPLPPSTAPSV